MRSILDLAPAADDDARTAEAAYHATLRRDERWPVCPLRAAMWDYGLIVLAVVCTLTSIVVQYA
ncbi:hypothetical protein [Novosphingobium sp. SG707]|uniref:hypothetical protein n=1 Tax=Novosphingobium sp. SG707 TaxID=2586996 RepID=UPI001446EFAE|nr:hypothetical protein [Novosphingobium sp. SG707]NKI99617.1 hypothetical protein [Novosphingobium sp. SG707]